MPICIAGMHRSATSMITRLLHICGLDVGDTRELIPAQPDNPEGFWEHVRFHSINDRILRTFQGNWDFPPEFPENWQQDPRLDDLRQEAIDLIKEFNGGPEWGWKDPRNSLTLAFWLDLIPDLKVVVPIRHPLEIAASMQNRGYGSPQFGVNLTTRYMESIERSLDGHADIYTHQSLYFGDPEPELRRLCEFGGLAPSSTQLQGALSTIQTGLRHSAYVLSDLVRPDLPSEALLQYLKDCSRCGAYYEPILRDQIEQLADLEGRHQKRVESIERKVTLKELENYHLQQEIIRLKRANQTEVANARTKVQVEVLKVLKMQASPTWEATIATINNVRAHQLEEARAQGRDETEGVLLPHLENVHREHKLQIKRLTTSRPYTIGHRIVRLKQKIAPNGSFRMRLISLCLRAVRKLRAQGPVAVTKAVWRRLTRKKVAPVVVAPIEPVAVPRPTYHVKENGVRAALREREWVHKRDVVTIPPLLISFDEASLAAQAKEIILPACDNPEVSLVIPVFGQIKYTLECLASIARNSGDVKFEVIVVDDCSTDLSGELLSQVENLNLIRNDTNIGFLGSCNAGAKAAKGEFVLLLNNDTQAMPGWLAPLIETFSKYPSVGAVGSKVLFPNGVLQEAGAIIYPNCSTEMLGYEDDPLLPKYNYVRKVDYCSGVCLMVRRTDWEELGGLCREYEPAYCEDVDLCLRLRQKGLATYCNPNSVIVHHLSITSNSLDNLYKQQLSVRNQQRIAEKYADQIEELNKVRTIAFYLPQFHPMPENDEWWGRGFTEWSNVSKARPSFKDHYQPHLPSDLGFYDLRVADVMDQQAKLAERYGINGFCYYYYWFDGKRLLDMPIERMLETGKPDFPFCLCWANENWTRRWDGKDQEVLMAQNHGDEDDKKVILDLIRYFRSPNYIRIDGKPLLVVYRVGLFPDMARTAKTWRETCREEGIGEIYLSMAETFTHADGAEPPSTFGFDSSMEFPPHGLFAQTDKAPEGLDPAFTGYLLDYEKAAMMYADRPVPDYTRFRSVMTGWDNTARQQERAVMFLDSSPESYGAWLEFVLKQSRKENSGDERIVFINAWNEWAEGAHLEPDKKHGHALLEVTRDMLEEALPSRSTMPLLPAEECDG